ncbi:MAG: hemin ABC transporter substrate-binding protein [Thermoflexibacter sp.]
MKIKTMKIKQFIVFCFAFWLSACTAYAQNRIVSVDGTLSELLCALGLENQIVGVDVTSTFPESLKKLPQVGHNRNIAAEGVLSLNPTLIVGLESSNLKPEVIAQLRAAGKKVQIFPRTYSIEGSKQLIREVAQFFQRSAQGEAIIKSMETDLAKLKKVSPSQKGLFIYARGVGSLMVSGEGTPLEKMFQLVGCENAVKGFANYKPLTAEALLLANPDFIILFNSGLESVGGVEGLLKVQGISQTKAGKNRKIIAMDGQLLTGFGIRVGKALVELSEKISQTNY